MTYLSVCSGIEAATVAAHPLGWTPWAFAEVDAFPSAVLNHHYPNVPNLGDMTKFQEWPDAAIDLLVGGTPCQSFSVAGLRAGLADPRGNLALVYLALADRYRPRWLVWENVPGVLSSAGGRDFGAFLGGLGELGYGFAYRVLDAQHFGLAQRRKRVFVVGYLGDWRRAAAVLFERASLSGHPAPRREAGQDVAGPLVPGAHPGGFNGQDIAGHLYAFGGNNTAGPIDVATAVNAHGGPCGRMDFESETFIAHALRAEGFDASEDGTGLETPLVPVAFDTTQITSKANRSNPQPGDPCHPLAAGAHPPAVAFHNRQDPDVSGAVTHPLGAKDNGLAIAFSAKDYGGDAGDLAPTLRAGGHTTSHANGGVMPAVAFQSSQSGVREVEAHATLDAHNGSRRQNGIAQGMQVRRLTPRECENLQGFSDSVKSCRIDVCGDQLKNLALADNPSPRLPSVAGDVDGNQFISRASSVERPSPVNHHKTSRPVVVSVEIDSEAGTMRLTIHPNGWSESVRIADESARTFLATPAADFARLIVAMLSLQAKTARHGRAEAPQSSNHSSRPENGSPVVVLSGPEIEAVAANAESVTSEAIRCFTFTTSEAGLSFQNCGWSIQTLCSCVARAIGSFIPDEIPLGDSFSIELTHRTPYTLIPYRGKPSADGPRYKALGNSMAVPVMRWIFERIGQVDAIQAERRGA